MKSILYFVLCACVVWGFAGEAQAKTNGNTLLEHCHDYADEATMATGFCLGYVLGVHEIAVDNSPGYCILTGVTNNQLVLVFAKYLKDNPAELHIEATTLVLMAFSEAFPCPEGE